MICKNFPSQSSKHRNIAEKISYTRVAQNFAVIINKSTTYFLIKTPNSFYYFSFSGDQPNRLSYIREVYRCASWLSKVFRYMTPTFVPTCIYSQIDRWPSNKTNYTNLELFC